MRVATLNLWGTRGDCAAWLPLLRDGFAAMAPDLLSGGVSRDKLISAGAAEVYNHPGELLSPEACAVRIKRRSNGHRKAEGRGPA
jgi:hypothetical protein